MRRVCGLLAGIMVLAGWPVSVPVSGQRSAVSVSLGQTSSALPAIAADFEAEIVSESQQGNRKVVRYEHEMLEAWGYPKGAPKRPFIVVEAATKTERPPLIVYLHGAGAKAEASIPTKIAGFGPEFYSLSLDCAEPRGYEGWYGWFAAAADRQKYAATYSPPEYRLLAEIEWIIRKHNIDRNRVYLWGHSMGGSGTLGLGMARGDIFAAIWAGVPAGIDHVWFRMGFPELEPLSPVPSPATDKPVGPTSRITHPPDYLRRISGGGLPDAPPIIDFSSQIDSWATNQENFIEACRDGRHLLVFCWAPFGHTQNYQTANPVALAYPWLSIRRDEAYPVFTDATSDQKYPGQWAKDGDQEGQINAYFRWQAVRDEPAKFQIELWLVADGQGTTRPVSIPPASAADVTLRRLQKFKVQAGTSYAWRFTESEKVIQAGTVQADEIGLLTIPRLTITGTPRVLTIEPKVTVALWGDSRENLDQACENIASILLHEITDWDVQVHTGDFTSNGTEEDWRRSLCYGEIKDLFVAGKFLLCTSNHDTDQVPRDTHSKRATWDKYTRGVLPINDQDGTTHFYAWHKGNVHIVFCDRFLTDSTTMQLWLDRYLEQVKPEEWLIAVWHNPVFDVTYKPASLPACGPWLESLAKHGGDFIFNGHAHLYLRTKTLLPDGTFDEAKGMAHIINGTGGASWKDPTPMGPQIAFTPSERSFPCITFVTFEGNTAKVRTVDARPGKNLETIDSWTWTK